MTTSQLFAKLKSLNVNFKIIELDGYSKDVVFELNGIEFKAGFNEDSIHITDFCREFKIDQSSQETHRRFFDNFNKLKKYAFAV